jgi:hypothetical protein
MRQHCRPQATPATRSTRKCGHSSDYFEPIAFGLQHKDLALVRKRARQRGDVDLMRYQDEHAGAAPSRDDGRGLARLLGLLPSLPKERVERREHLGLSEGELRCLARPAPSARQHAVDADAALAERLAETTRLRAARLGQVALRRAIIEPEVYRIARAGRPCVPDQRNHAAGPQRVPRRIAGRGSTGRRRQT